MIDQELRYQAWNRRAGDFYIAARKLFRAGMHYVGPGAFCGFQALENQAKALLLYDDPNLDPEGMGHKLSRLARCVHARFGVEIHPVLTNWRYQAMTRYPHRGDERIFKRLEEENRKRLREEGKNPDDNPDEVRGVGPRQGYAIMTGHLDSLDQAMIDMCVAGPRDRRFVLAQVLRDEKDERYADLVCGNKHVHRLRQPTGPRA
ncbi:MAG: hypothetical protein AAF627_19465 [Myxococcota bacterium]